MIVKKKTNTKTNKKHLLDKFIPGLNLKRKMNNRVPKVDRKTSLRIPKRGQTCNQNP
jgi:hypothetical protein